MKTFALAVVAVLAVVVTAGASAAPPKPPGPPPPPPPAVGHVYINDNTAVNAVAGFNRQHDGSLTPIPGSPFLTGGAGLGKGETSQGSLQLSDDGHFLLAVDAGSNDISVLRIRPDGSLVQADGGPVSSGGVNPVSIAVSHNLVYVANQGPGTNPGDANYTGFTLDPRGHLTPIPGSTVALSPSDVPADVVLNKDGHRLVGTLVGSSKIDSFTVGPHGTLTSALGSPFDPQSFSPPQGYGQFGSEFNPNNPDQLIVTDAHNAAGGGAPGLVSSYHDGRDGTLTPIGPSPVSENGTGAGACWIDISRDGKYAYVVNTGTANISTFAIGHDGSLSFVRTTAPGELGAGAFDDRLSPDGSTLWVVQMKADAVTGFSVSHDGTLTPLSSAPGPAGAAPTGIVVT